MFKISPLHYLHIDYYHGFKLGASNFFITMLKEKLPGYTAKDDDINKSTWPAKAQDVNCIKSLPHRKCAAPQGSAIC